MKKVVHERKSCAGCGVCAGICPEFFGIDRKDGKARLKKIPQNLTKAQIEKIEQVAQVCPLKLIKILEE